MLCHYFPLVLNTVVTDLKKKILSRKLHRFNLPFTKQRKFRRKKIFCILTGISFNPVQTKPGCGLIQILYKTTICILADPPNWSVTEKCITWVPGNADWSNLVMLTCQMLFILASVYNSRLAKALKLQILLNCIVMCPLLPGLADLLYTQSEEPSC